MSRKNKGVTEDLFWQSGIKNNATYIQYFNRLTELAISMFEWKNLPDTIDERFLELTLFTNGNILFFKDSELGYLSLPSANYGNFNVYRIPQDRSAYASNGYHIDLNAENSVIIYNNMLRTNSVLDVRMFAERLYNLDRAIDVNANAQKTPVLLQCSENERLSILNIYKQYDGNSPVVFGDKMLNKEPLRVLKTDAPYVCDRLYTLKTQYWNECLTYLGIDNLNQTKRERLISDEARLNSGSTVASRYSRLNARKQACKQINVMFDLNIDVEYRQLSTEEISIAGIVEKSKDGEQK